MKKLELTSGASTEETQQLIRGRLLELGVGASKRPRGSRCIFLIDDEGIIVSTENVSSLCTSHYLTQSPEHVRNNVRDHVGNNHDEILLSENNVTGNKV